MMGDTYLFNALVLVRIAVEFMNKLMYFYDALLCTIICLISYLIIYTSSTEARADICLKIR